MFVKNLKYNLPDKDCFFGEFGRDFTYADFAPMFKAMSYDANEWAKLFERAGARYAVLTTKHHDGFALWPSKEASTSYGRPWNSMVIGAHRDLVGEYVDALRWKVPCQSGWPANRSRPARRR